MHLGVNIDHVATLRQARYSTQLGHPNSEPRILEAASACERAGALGITIHLRADRRHIQDVDLFALRKSVVTKLNLELGNTREILEIALRVLPDDVCLVPENRQEITTEGGLDAVRHFKALTPTITRLQSAGIRVSLFIDPEHTQIEAAAALGVEMIELHTGAFANAEGQAQTDELARLTDASQLAQKKRLIVNAGHGINYVNIGRILDIPGLQELNIGHSIVSRSILVGLETAVREMLAAMAPYRG